MPPRKNKQKAVQIAPPLIIPGSSTYPGKKDGKGLEAPQWEACRRMVEGVYNTTEDGIRIAEIFCDLPDRTDFSDYYETIPEPECLNNVAQMLSDQAFPTPDKFFAQLLLIFLNAKHYNEDGSQLYEDATDFEEQIWAEWRKSAAEGIFKGEPHLPKTETRKGKKGGLEPPKAEGRNSATPAAASPLPEPPKPVPAQPVASSSRPTRSAPVVLPQPQSPNHPLPRGLSAADRQVVAALDAKLPRWSGPVAVLPGPKEVGGVRGSGWWGEDQPEFEASPAGQGSRSSRIRNVINAVTGYRDKDNLCLAETLDRVPPLIDLPYLSYSGSVSLAAIRHKSDRGEYRSLAEADVEVTRLFERARRWYLEGTTEYGHTLILQRLYNALTSSQPSVSPLPIPAPSSTNFSTIIAGPGRARPTTDTESTLAITHQKVPNKDRIGTPEVRHKGVSYRLGDYVHLIHPDDATRPIVGQVFRTFVPTKGSTSHHVTVCWYFRPEQTVHTADRQFMDRELLKTGHLCDHPVDDLIEKVSVQFLSKYVRGRSRAGEYFPGWPLYVCQSRFNDRYWQTIRIKNWASCIPEELRQSEFMSLVNFERPIEPLLFPSPLLPSSGTGITGPGFIAEPCGQITEEEDEDKVAPPPPAKSAPAQRSTQPATAMPATASTSAAAAHRPQTATSGGSTKTFGAMYGGQQAMDMIAYKEYLPVETSRLFDRDARQAVMWFSGPPLPSTQESQRPTHALAYLAHLTKRKRALADDGPEQPAPQAHRS